VESYGHVLPKQGWASGAIRLGRVDELEVCEKRLEIVFPILGEWLSVIRSMANALKTVNMTFGGMEKDLT
jgi:hypothetical protein